MRTTLEIDDAILAVAREMAHSEGLSIGAALSRLAEMGLRARSTDVSLATASGFPTFVVPADAKPITQDLVNEYRDAD